jgi:hypothetical protein
MKLNDTTHKISNLAISLFKNSEHSNSMHEDVFIPPDQQRHIQNLSYRAAIALSDLAHALDDIQQSLS